MSKVVRKMFWAWQLEREKAYLEEMARQGLILEHVRFGGYSFAEASPEDIVYEMDFKGFDRHLSEGEYLQLYEDAGWTFVARLGAWYYFCRNRSDEADESLFSDNQSKRAVYRRLLIFLLITGFPLYYQVVIMFPLLDTSETTFPSFYFFFRIVVTVFVLVHAFALVKIGRLYIRLKRNIRE